MKTGYIYIIKSKKTDDVYIGSTKHTILKRFKYHERDFNEGKNKCSSKDIIKYGDAYCELLEKVIYDDIKELRNKEKEIIKSKKYNCVNIVWNTLEEDDVIDKDEKKIQKEILKKEKLEKQKELSYKIINQFVKNDLYDYKNFREKIKNINIYNELMQNETTNRKILGKINSIIKIINVCIINTKVKKQKNGKRSGFSYYKLIDRNY
jgi:hypothetical protein